MNNDDRQRAPKLTDQGRLRRRRILLVLNERGPLPVRHLGDAIGLSSPGSTQHHIEYLRTTGLIAHVSGWQITDKGRAVLENTEAYE